MENKAKIDKEKMLFDAKSHLKKLKSRMGESIDHKLLKEQIENTESLIRAIENNEPIIG